MSLPGPFVFELTEDEAKIAASRAGLRTALSGGLTAGHVAPLAAFVLALAFIAILAFTDLLARRHAEIALLIAAAAYMAHRLFARRKLVSARRASLATIEALRAAGPLTLTLDDCGATLSSPTRSKRWLFADCDAAEDAGGLVYLWPRSGPPAVAPTRALHGPEDACELVNYFRARIGARLPRMDSEKPRA